MLHTWNNKQYAPAATPLPGELPGNKKGWGFPEKQARLFFGKSPAFFLCACAQAGRQSRPARERCVFVSSATAEHCLIRKSCSIRNGWGPGRIILPGRVWGSAPAFSLLLRHTAWEISLIPSATVGVRGGSSSPAGFGAAPRRFFRSFSERGKSLLTGQSFWG